VAICMSSPCKTPLLSGVFAGCVFGAVLVHRADAADLLKVCIDQANPTAAVDRRVARATAESQGLEFVEVPFEGGGIGDDGFPPSRFAKMADSDCQLIMGFPVDIDNPNLPAHVVATSPYAGTGFVLVRRAKSSDLDVGALPQGSEVGIAQLDTYAGLLYGQHPNIVMHVYDKESAMLADLKAKRIAAGLAWQPSIEAYQLSNRNAPPFSLHTIAEKHMQWNLVALYTSRSQAAADSFEKGLHELQSSAALQPLIAPYRSATIVKAAPTSAHWPAPHLQSAMAWDSDGGRMTTVADRPAAKGGNSKVPALYTTDQATQGALAYYQNCAMCHGPNLDGQSAGYSGPALKGKDFADPSYDFHVSDIFNFVSKQMPAATPGSLSHTQDVQIMAFILQQNGYPAGTQELVYEQAEKSKVPIRYHGK